MEDTFCMRRMRRSELDLILQWAAAEGWNPGSSDADAFYAADPDGFFVGTIGGHVVASISVVAYDESYAFLGFYLVRPECRGRGYGSRLWRHALEQTAARTIGLDGVVAQIPTYERAGFRPAHRTLRYVIRSGEHPAPSALVRPLEPVDLARVNEYDARVFGAPRPTFLAVWLGRAGIGARLAERDGAVAGYGAIRPAVDGYRIGPLFAESPLIANELLDDLLASVPPGIDVAIDVPEAHPEASAMIRVRHATAAFETARMYLGPAPAEETRHVYGTTSLELG